MIFLSRAVNSAAMQARLGTIVRRTLHNPVIELDSVYEVVVINSCIASVVSLTTFSRHRWIV